MRIILLALFILPQHAFAYLDPGTGNALLYLLIGLFGTIIYSLKSFFYKTKALITGKSENIRSLHSIAIFSEGKNYFHTFKPIIDALIKKEIYFNYYSMDIYDPALTYLNDFMDAKYIGSGTKAYLFMGKIKNEYLLATTPNIGNTNYPMKKSPHLKSLIHIFHAIGDIAFYHKGSLDSYDEVLMPGDFALESIRLIEKRRSLKTKTCLSMGLPYYDLLHKNKIIANKNPSKTILVAPSWGPKGLLQIVGHSFLIDLAKQGYPITLRFHPHSLKVEIDLVQKVQDALKSFQNVKIDKNLDGADSFSKADLMISDSSGVRFDFAFLYEKPVISLDAVSGDFSALEASQLPELWAQRASKAIGPTLQAHDFKNIIKHVESAFHYCPTQIKEFKESTLKNIGSSGEAIAQYLLEKTTSGNCNE